MPPGHQEDGRRTRGHCYRWGAYDTLMYRGAGSGVRIMPLLIGSPRWAAPSIHSPPSSAARQHFYDFARAAADRYGPNGYFWRQRTGTSPSFRPLLWQVWNEPNTDVYWANSPNPRSYASLLKGASRAAKGGDSSVQVVAGGLTYPPRGGGMDPRDFLRAMIASDPQVAGAFVSVGLHPYATTPSGVVANVKKLRLAMNGMRLGPKSIYITEIGWSSAAPNGRLQVGSQQDDHLRDLFNRLLGVGGYSSAARAYGVRGAFWFALQDVNRRNLTWSKTTGLLDASGNPKAAWHAFRRVTGAR